MKGKLIFDITSLEEITIDCQLKGVDWLGKLCLFDSLMQAIGLDAADRLLISRMIAQGGIDKMEGLGAETEVIRVDRNAVAEVVRRIDGYLA